MRVRYLQVASALATCTVIAVVTLSVSLGQDAEQLTEREDLERTKGMAVNACLTTPVEDLPMYSATDSLRTIRAWINQDNDTLWESMCEAEKEALGSRERYQEFLQTFESEFAVKPTLYWVYSIQKASEPPTASPTMDIQGLAYDRRNEMISRISCYRREQPSVLRIHVSQLTEYAWPTQWGAPLTPGGMRGLHVDELAFPQNEMARAYVPVFQHRIERLKQHVDQLEAFGVTAMDMCAAQPISHRDSIAHFEKLASTLMGEQYDD